MVISYVGRRNREEGVELEVGSFEWFCKTHFNQLVEASTLFAYSKPDYFNTMERRFLIGTLNAKTIAHYFTDVCKIPYVSFVVNETEGFDMYYRYEGNNKYFEERISLKSVGTDLLPRRKIYGNSFTKGKLLQIKNSLGKDKSGLEESFDFLLVVEHAKIKSKKGGYYVGVACAPYDEIADKAVAPNSQIVVDTDKVGWSFRDCVHRDYSIDKNIMLENKAKSELNTLFNDLILLGQEHYNEARTNTDI